MRTLAFTIFALLLSCQGCHVEAQAVQPAPPPAPSAQEPEPVVHVEGVNEAACAKLKELKCVSRDGRNLWEPTPGGVSCVDVFLNAEKNGVDQNAPCIASLTRCEDRSACTSGR